MSDKPKVLVVDDNDTNLAIINEILEEQHEVAFARSGEQALGLAKTFQPELILLDIMMPGIDGYETCRQLRQEDSLKSTKIVMLSAKAMATDKTKGYEAGADYYITKPFEEDELLQHVTVYCSYP